MHQLHNSTCTMNMSINTTKIHNRRSQHQKHKTQNTKHKTTFGSGSIVVTNNATIPIQTQTQRKRERVNPNQIQTTEVRMEKLK